MKFKIKINSKFIIENFDGRNSLSKFFVRSFRGVESIQI